MLLLKILIGFLIIVAGLFLLLHLIVFIDDIIFKYKVSKLRGKLNKLKTEIDCTGMITLNGNLDHFFEANCLCPKVVVSPDVVAQCQWLNGQENITDYHIGQYLKDKIGPHRIPDTAVLPTLEPGTIIIIR